MSKKVKLVILIACTAAAALLWPFCIFQHKRSLQFWLQDCLSPSGSEPYIVFETPESYYPVSVSDLLSKGQYAIFREGSAGNQILSIAKTAKECAVLIEDGEDGIFDIYAVNEASS